jgi:hypothetical protein
MLHVVVPQPIAKNQQAYFGGTGEVCLKEHGDNNNSQHTQYLKRKGRVQ